MRVINFMPVFVPKIESGEKVNTIRASNYQIFPGQVLSLRYWSGKPYCSKQCEIKRVTCASVSPVCLWNFPETLDSGVMIGGLVFANLEECAKDDGFNLWGEMTRFFFPHTHGKGSFVGFFIKWEGIQ